MSRNLILYALAGLTGFAIFFVLRGFLGPELMAALALIGLVAGAVIVWRNLQTNRNVLEATAEQRAEALAFAPLPNKAVLYVFRNQFVGRAVGVTVIIDGREVAQLKSPRLTRIVLTAGAHRIAGYTGTNKKPSDSEGMAFTANAGDVLVMKTEVEAQMVGATIKFTPIALDAARADVAKITRMVMADPGEI